MHTCSLMVALVPFPATEMGLVPISYSVPAAMKNAWSQHMHAATLRKQS